MTGTHIVMIIVVIMAFTTLQAWIKRRHEKPPARDEEAEELLHKIDVLEERIQVLERIITERNFDLKQKIDSL